MSFLGVSEKINDIINRNNELSRKIKDILGEINQELEKNKENAAVREIVFFLGG